MVVRYWLPVLCTSLIILGLTACNMGPESSLLGDTGAVSMALSIPPDSALDVAQVEFRVVPDNGDPAQVRTVALEEEELPEAVDATLAGSRFADWFVQLDAGGYTVSATPLQGDGSPSAFCAVASSPVTVVKETTVELMLVSNCTVDGSGGLDTTVIINTPPHITSIEYSPSKFVCANETSDILAAAVDESSAVLDYTWTSLSIPAGADASNYCLGSASARSSMTANAEGRYELTADVSDGYSMTSMVIPLYVTFCDGTPPVNPCDDGDDCTIDTCETEEGCFHRPCATGECPGGCTPDDAPTIEPELLTGLTNQEVTGAEPNTSLTLDLFTSVWYPYHPVIATVTTPTGVTSDTSAEVDSQCTADVCEELFRFTFSADPARCDYNGTYTVTFDYVCDPDAVDCSPFDAAYPDDSVVIELESTDHCP